MKFIVTNVNTNITQTSYSTFSGNVNVPNIPEITVELQITEFKNNEVNSIESIENALKQNPYDWLTKEELDKIVAEKYPEYFL